MYSLKKNINFTIIIAAFVVSGWTNLIAEREERNEEEPHDRIHGIYMMALEEFDIEHEMKERALEFYRENFPEVHEEVKKRLMKDDHDEVVEYINEQFEEFFDAQDEREENPDRFKSWVKYKKLTYRSIALAAKIAKSSGKNQKPKLEKELMEILNQLFTMRMQMDKNELNDLEKEINELRILIKKREAKRERIIKKRFEELLEGDEEEFDW